MMYHNQNDSFNSNINYNLFDKSTEFNSNVIDNNKKDIYNHI
jgi:hypothetical protein